MAGSTISIFLAFAFAMPAFALAGSNEVVIHAGDALTNGCRLNFVFDSLRQSGPLVGKVWVGTAASCVVLGEVVSTATATRFGRVVYRGDAGSEENGIPGLQSDFALIEPGEGFVAALDPAIRGTDLPRYSPMSPEFTSQGDGLVLAPLPDPSSSLGSHIARQGVLIHDDHRSLRAGAPLLPGEAGGPVVHAPSGRALGMHATTGLACCFGDVDAPYPVASGPTILWLQYELGALGYLMESRSVR